MILARRRAAKPAPVARMGWQSSARTHVGKIRQLNEDRYLDAPDRRLWVVADGMGGHDAGDVAATAVVQALALLCEGDTPVVIGAVEDTLKAVNKNVGAALRRRGQMGGCTVAGLHLDGEEACVFWAGDSRVYRLRDHALERLSHDHSVVQEMMDAGLIDPATARSHPQANVITRAVGVEPDLRLEMRRVALAPRDRFLICSDGITTELSETKIAAHLLSDRVAPADAIMQEALAGPARDNLTLIVVF